MSSVDFLVKMRDGVAIILDACNEELERRKPSEVKYNEEDFNKLFWETKIGTKGEYQQTSKKATNNHPIFQGLQTILKKHNGFVQLGSYRYWFHQSAHDVIDRRRK